MSVIDFLSTVHFFARVDLGLRARAEDGGEAAVTAAGKPPHLDLPEAADAPKRVVAGDVALEAREGRRDAQSSPLFHELDDAAAKGLALLALGVRGQRALGLQLHRAFFNSAGLAC